MVDMQPTNNSTTSANLVSPRQHNGDFTRVTLTLKERIHNIFCNIFTLGYNRYKQNSVFRAAVFNNDFKSAEKAIKNGAANYLDADDILVLVRNNQVKAVTFLFKQAVFADKSDNSQHAFLNAVWGISRYETYHLRPEEIRLLKIFVEHHPASIRNLPNINPHNFNSSSFFDALDIWIDAGSDPNACKTYPNQKITTLLGAAALTSSKPGLAILKLINAGAKTNEVSFSSWQDYYSGYQTAEGTPLELALHFPYSSSPEVVKALLDNGAKITKKALESSVACRSEVSKLLFESSDLPKEYFSQEMLQSAVNSQNNYCMELMIKRGFRPNMNFTHLTRIPHRDEYAKDYTETTKFLVQCLPELANEQLLSSAIYNKNLKLALWLVEQNPSLKQTEACKKFAAETHQKINEQATLAAAFGG